MREEMRGLAQSIVASHEARATGLASIRRDVSGQRERDRRHVQELQATRREAGRTLHGHLARGRATLARNEGRRKSQVNSWMSEVTSAHRAMAQELRFDLGKGHADLRASVTAQLQELDRAHQAMARQQRQGLAKVHTDLNRAETRRKAGVHSWMEEVAAAHGAAREEWQNLAATMQAKRAGVVVAEAPPAVAPAPPAIEEVAPAAPEEEVEVGEVTEELAAISARVFTYLANHPDGTRLTELEHEFGLGRFQAARVVRHLMNEGKAKKQGLLYFAT